jgi:Suppressor of fused protein (SUFU)
MESWFNDKKEPDGTNIIRHENVETKLGVAKGTAGFAQADKDVPKRVELIFYCSEPRDEYISTLRWVAHFPHDSKSWLGHGHTMPNGHPPAPFWGSTDLDTLFFLPPIVKKDQTLASELSLGGDPVTFFGSSR